MTSSFPEQQYNPQALSGGFNPIDQVDLAPAIAAEQARQIAPERARLQELAANDRVSIENAGQYGRNLQALGEFSQTLATQMVEYQEKENEKAMQRGMMQAFTDGVSLSDKVAFDLGESDLKTADTILKKDAADVEASGGSVFTGEKIRSFSGWENYGYYKGKMQVAAQGFPLFIQQNADGNDPKYTVTINGQEISLNSARTPEEASAVLSKMVSGYLAPFAGVNPVMADKYLLTPMRASMQQQMVLFAQKRGAEIKQERLTERLNTFILGLNSANEEGLIDYVDEKLGRVRITPGQYGLNFINDYPAGYAAGKRELAEILKTGVDNGSISRQQAERIIADPVKWRDGSTASLLKKDPGVFGFLPQLIEDARISDINRENQLEAAEQEEFLDGLEEIALSDGKYTATEKLAAIQAWKNSPYGSQPIPERLSGLYTTEDGVKDQQRLEFQAIADANGGVIAPQYVVGKDPEVVAEFADQVGAGAAVESISQKQQTAIKEYLTGVKNELNLYTEGTTSFKNRDTAIQAMNVDKQFYDMLGKNIVDYGVEDGLNKTIEQMNAKVDKFNITKINPFEKLQSADEEAYFQRKKAQLWVQDKDLPTIAEETRIIGISDSDLEGAYTYLKTGKGEVPYIFRYLAGRDPRISALELADKQLKISGYKGYNVPKIEIDLSNSPNDSVRKMLRYQNSPSRTLRASIEDPELVNVLDLIAGVESEGSGGYDAYNQGGYSANDPYGSGDSSDGQMFGKPISQMTIGELMKWQAKPKNQLGIHAAGRYQFIADTLKDVVRQMGITKDMVFSPQLQDAMALHRLRWRLNINNSTTGLINEWAGLRNLSKKQLLQLLEDAQDVYEEPYNRPELLLKGL